MSDAQLVVKLCQTYNCTPRELDEQGPELIRMLEIIRHGTKQEEEEVFDG